MPVTALSLQWSGYICFYQIGHVVNQVRKESLNSDGQQFHQY